MNYSYIFPYLTQSKSQIDMIYKSESHQSKQRAILCIAKQKNRAKEVQ